MALSRSARRAWPAALCLSVLFAACGPEAPPPEVTQLDAAAVARQADSIRQTVAAEVAGGLRLDLWASEALLADPVALDIDDRGRAYVTRTFRQDNSEFDIRGHRNWMTRSIALQSVEDRRAFLREWFDPARSDSNAWLPDLNGDSLHDWRDLTVEQEEIYRIDDTDADGRADRSQLFLRAFDDEVTDVAGAILAHDEAVYVGVAPDMWRLEDRDDDGWAEERESISHGYGVHIGFGGHGMSGATVGPDGRLYWGIGDIGMNVEGPDGQAWSFPNEGVIVRSEPDGSGFEVFAHGLRNTHEFAFDAWGNLISVDNDGDHPGERERLVYIVEGSDSGWRINWQFGKYTDPANNGYKVWMDEGMYLPRHDEQAAYFLPPLANYHSGPAGMTYNPGTALGGQWQDHFFVAEFPGAPSRARIHAFQLEEDGAGFRLAREEVLVQGVLATGLDIGPDGALYFADWIDGWNTKDQGRIWRLAPEGAGTQAAAEVARLLAEDFDEKDDATLAGLLRHADQRIRLHAQFALADREDRETLAAAARQTTHRLARAHGLWGLGQLARRGDEDAAEIVAALLGDGDAEVRAQAAKTLGDIRYADAAPALVGLLGDEAPRVQFFALEALGRLGHRPAYEPVLDLLEADAGRDTYLRHTGATALARLADPGDLAALSGHPSRPLRIAAVVALRRLRDPAVARFLDDSDEYIVAEAARAINDDGGIVEARPALAALLPTLDTGNEALARRVLNAALLEGDAEAARAVARYAAGGAAAPGLRAEAVRMLGVWPEPSPMDRVDGRYRGPISRDVALARAALGEQADALLADAEAEVRQAATEAFGRLDYEDGAPALLALVRRDPDPDVRAAALRALSEMDVPAVQEAVQVALEDADQTVRMTALGLGPALDMEAERVAEMLASVVGRRSTEEQQSALVALGQMNHPAAHAALADMLTRLEAGTLPREVHLDFVEAVAAGGSAEVRDRLERFRTAAIGDDEVAAYRETLYGGDPDRGRQLFFRHEAAQCVRCHAVGGYGGGDVGPALDGIGGELSRQQLLESLVAPSVRIAPGFGSVTLTLAGGQVVSGIVERETDQALTLRLGDGTERRVPRSDIRERRDAPSAMPPMGLVLERRELRDLIAFLAALQ